MTRATRWAAAALLAALVAAAVPYVLPTAPGAPEADAASEMVDAASPTADARRDGATDLRGRGPRASALRRMHTIAGEVLLDGQRVAGASVEVRALGAAPRAVRQAFQSRPVGGSDRSLVTDTEGRFEVASLEAGLYEVVGRGPEGTKDASVVWFGSEDLPTRRTLLLDLVATAAVDGRVVTPGGDSRFVTAIADGYGATCRAPVSTDGAFRLEGLPTGRDIEVRFVTAGEDEFVRTEVRVPHRGIWIVHVASSRELEGRVVDARTGAPLPGASVVAAWNDDGGSGGALTQSLQDGSFRVRAALASSLTVSAAAIGHRDASVSAEGQARVALSLAPLVRIEARVVAPDGSSARGVRVVPWLDGGNIETGGARSDTNGTFAFVADEADSIAFRVEDGTWSFVGVTPAGEGAASARPTTTVRTPSDGGPVRLDLHVAHGSLLKGRVLYGDDAPAAGAQVLLAADESTQLVPLEAITDAEGRFRLAVPPAARQAVMTVYTGDAGHLTTSIAAAADGTYRETTVRVRRVASDVAIIRVVDRATGAPVRGARLVGDAGGFVTALTTASDGCLRAGGRTRLHDVVVSADGFAPLRVPSLDPSMTISLDRGVVVSGRLTLPDGTPVAGASVSLVVEGEPGQLTTPDADGRFRFDALDSPRGRVLVHALGGGAAIIDQEVSPSSGPLELRVDDDALRAADAVRIRVRDEAGTDVARCAFRVRGNDQADPVDGAVALVTRVGPNAGSPSVAIERAVRSRDAVALARRVVALPPQRPSMDVVLVPARPVEGRVEAPEGVALDVHLVLSRFDSNAESAGDPPTRTALGGRGFSARADAQGRFVLWDVPEDGCVVAAAAAEGLCAAPVRVAPGDRDVRLVLRLAPDVTLRVVDARGGPVSMAFVGAHDPGAADWRAWTRTDEDGVATLSRLDPAAPSVLVVDATDTGLPQHRRTSWSPRNELVVMDEPGTVTGTIVGPADETLTATGVWWTQADEWHWTWADVAGRFRVTGLGAGTVRLSADLSGTAVPDSSAASVHVDVGARDVRLTIAEGDAVTVHFDRPLPDGAPVWFGTLGEEETWWRGYVVDATTARLRRCEPHKSYVVWSPAAEDGSVVWHEGLRPPCEAHARRRPGGEITVRVRDASSSSVKVECAHGRLVLPATRGDDGTFRATGLPDVAFRVRVTASEDGREVVVERTASVGDRLDVSIADPRRR